MSDIDSSFPAPFSSPSPDAVVLGGYRRTRKWSLAIHLFHSLGLQPVARQQVNQDQVYGLLNSAGYFWNSVAQNWEQTTDGPLTPNPAIRIRIWSDSSFLDSDVSAILSLLQSAGYTVVSRSPFYVCRPPQHLESRCYIELLRSND